MVKPVAGHRKYIPRENPFRLNACKRANDDPETIRRIARIYVQSYYHDFLYAYDKIHRFYKDGMLISRPQYGYFLQNFKIKEMEGIMSPRSYYEVELDLENIVAHSFESGFEIMVDIDGRFIGNDKTVSFTQCFLLEKHKGKKGEYNAVYDEFKYTHGENKKSVSDEEGSVIGAEHELQNCKGILKGPQREDESGKESQNFFGKELLEAGAGKTYAAALNELPCPGSGKTTILTEHQKLNPKVNDGSGSKSQNTPPKGHTLDLHGQKSDQAEHSIIDELLKYSSPDRDVTVRMIPGLGNNSVDGPVLNPLLLDFLERLDLNYELCNSGGAVDITIEKGWSGSLRSSNVQTSGQIFDFSEGTFVVKDASSSKAQVSRSAGKYMITAKDNDGYVAVIEDFKLRIRDMKNDVISVPIDGNIFQQENVDTFYVFKEDLIDFCNMKTVDVTIISAEMRLFFANHKKSCKSITFLDPAFSCTNLSLGISEGLKKDKKNQLLFIPYIVLDKTSLFQGHWVLMVIDCATMTVYWVDSLHIEPDVTLGNHVKTGLNNSLFTSNTVQPIWEIIKAPMQPADSGQCGYLVMKFMRDLITDGSSQSIKMKMDKLARKETCTQEEINSVRAEFGNYIITVLEKISSAPAVPSPDN